MVIRHRRHARECDAAISRNGKLNPHDLVFRFMKRSLALIIAVAFVLALASAAVYRAEAEDSVGAEKEVGSSLILSRTEIPAVTVDGAPISQLSALAWDEDEQLLYALSDRGVLFHFRVRVVGNVVKEVESVRAIPLVAGGVTDAGGRGIDTEDMALSNHANGIKGDSELFVVTEREPRFLRIRPSGTVLQVMPVPPPLDMPENFQKLNQGLESLVLHPIHGLVTAPETPLIGAPAQRHTLYAKEGAWMFERYSADARLKAMALLDDGDLLVLERSRVPDSKLMTASLRQVSLQACAPGHVCPAEVKLILPEDRSNFEGLAHFRGRQFFLVNDHSGKDGQGASLLLVQLP